MPRAARFRGAFLRHQSSGTKTTFDFKSFGEEDNETDEVQSDESPTATAASAVSKAVERGAKRNLLDGIREIMDAHPDHVVLTEVGSFYEVRMALLALLTSFDTNPIALL